MAKYQLQRSAKKWSLGCMIPASWPPLAAGARFTQPRDHSLADPCMMYDAFRAHILSQAEVVAHSFLI